MRKRIIALSALALALIFVLAGCGAQALEGTTWKIVGGANTEGSTITEDMVDSIFGEITYEFGENGTGTGSGAGITFDISYTQDGSDVTISAAGGEEMSGKISGDKLTVTASTGTMIFEKQ